MNDIRWSDNLLEDYFIELLVKKHVIQREINEIIELIDASELHDDYNILLKKVLLWEKNFYIENWWTLEWSMMDIVQEHNIRDNDTGKYGIVLQLIVRIVEYIFNIDDEHFHNFIHSESRESIEHTLIILIKRAVHSVEITLAELLVNLTNLDKPIENWMINKEFDVLKNTLKNITESITKQEEMKMNELKLEVTSIELNIHTQKKHLHQARMLPK